MLYLKLCQGLSDTPKVNHETNIGVRHVVLSFSACIVTTAMAIHRPNRMRASTSVAKVPSCVDPLHIEIDRRRLANGIHYRGMDRMAAVIDNEKLSALGYCVLSVHAK